MAKRPRKQHALVVAALALPARVKRHRHDSAGILAVFSTPAHRPSPLKEPAAKVELAAELIARDQAAGGPT
jgi:hypothetical protein